MRLQRQRMSSDDFEALKLIGRGAFGEVLPDNDNETLPRKPLQPPQPLAAAAVPSVPFRNSDVRMCQYLSFILRMVRLTSRAVLERHHNRKTVC